MLRGKHSVKVESIEEYKEAVEAAETLDLEISEIEASRNGWETPDADAVHPRGTRFDIKKVGHKYIHFEFSKGDVCRAEFGTNYDKDSAYLRLHFN
jgi:hypothetical protein